MDADELGVTLSTMSILLKTIACHARIDRAIVLLLLALDKPSLGGPET
jgi:hypothetical protein